MLIIPNSSDSAKTVEITYDRLLQLITGPYIISIPQLVCDYILAFGALGLAGIFHNKKCHHPNNSCA